MNDPAAKAVADQRHCCAVVLFDGIVCDIPEHVGIECSGCTPYVHSDGSIDHEPDCTAVEVSFTTGTDADYGGDGLGHPGYRND